jgi:hypothetical protein
MARVQARARAVDMLGRQQIAGIQNAVSELFKNAHDAYADKASVDYFEALGANGEDFLVIRDNGIGMTYEDFEGKWLVLGTESKVGAGRDAQYRPVGMPVRSLTGEKGIGRLAIGLLGRQVLVLTRARREDGLHDLVAALIHWGLFELPGVNLEEIEISMIRISAGLLPDAGQLSALSGELSACARRIAVAHAGDAVDRIVREIEQFAPDPQAMSQFFVSRGVDPLSLEGEGAGTHFLIGPANPMIRLEMAVDEASNDYSFRRQMLGFCDTIFGDDQSKIIETAFRHWPSGTAVGNDLLDPEGFFTRKELDEKTDHFLKGSVDKHGQFAGTLRVYAKTYENLVVPWPESKGRETECGPFKIAFGYLMGNRSESQVDTEDFLALNAKLNNLGGMYVYRDRIRVLPYGDYGFDWLEVEKRRNKGAGYYFFSFRRMVGAVMLTREDNGTLHEKAGREGFQLNEAYRNLRDRNVSTLLRHLEA